MGTSTGFGQLGMPSEHLAIFRWPQERGSLLFGIYHDLSIGCSLAVKASIYTSKLLSKQFAGLWWLWLKNGLNNNQGTSKFENMMMNEWWFRWFRDPLKWLNPLRIPPEATRTKLAGPVRAPLLAPGCTKSVQLCLQLLGRKRQLAPIIFAMCDPRIGRENCRLEQLETAWNSLKQLETHTLIISGDTSSTAQGGGGSFKNRKPIGEVGCCESGMAERIHWWTERCLRSPLFRSLSLTIYLPTYLSSMYLSIYRSISLSLSFICLSV